jgi:Ca2+-binding EF-hand superfamily protein
MFAIGKWASELNQLFNYIGRTIMQKISNSKLRQTALLFATLTALTWGVTSAQAAATESVPEAFKAMDANGDGFVTAGEAEGGKIATEVFVAADRDKDGKLDSYEYVSAGLEKEGAKPQ